MLLLALVASPAFLFSIALFVFTECLSGLLLGLTFESLYLLAIGVVELEIFAFLSDLAGFLPVERDVFTLSISEFLPTTEPAQDVLRIRCAT